MLWRASNTDGLYGSGLVQYPSTNGGTGNHIGTELSADVRWRVDPHLTISAIAARFLAGPAVRQPAACIVWPAAMYHVTSSPQMSPPSR